MAMMTVTMAGKKMDATEAPTEYWEWNAIVGNGANSECLARNRPDLSFGLEKRSGRTEQWPKRPQKYDLIRRFRPF